MAVKHVTRCAARVSRPDVEEYHLETLTGERLELWWDEQMGVKGTEAEGWCVRLIDSRGERDIPVKGRRNSKWSTILRNLSQAVR